MIGRLAGYTKPLLTVRERPSIKPQKKRAAEPPCFAVLI